MKKRFLLVTANNHETNALLNCKNFNYEKNQRAKATDDNNFYNVGEIGNYDIIHFELQNKGTAKTGAALFSINAAIKGWEPDAVILLGIAFGKENGNEKNPKQHIGDVLISEIMVDCESGKITNGKFLSDGVRAEAGETLLSVFKNYSKTWENYSGSRKLKCEFGMILSGNKVVDDLVYKKKLFKDAPRAIGGEMEGRGAYAACKKARMDEWIIVKAICDWGVNKENPNKEKNQIMASKAAVSLLEHVFLKKNAFDKLPKKRNISTGSITQKKKQQNNMNKKPKKVAGPLGYFINIGTTSCRLFEIIDKDNSKELEMISYNCDVFKDNFHLDEIIACVKSLLQSEKVHKNDSQMLRKVFVDYRFGEIFNENEPKKLKDVIRKFYKETNLYFNIISKEKTTENIDRLFGNLSDGTAIINIGSHCTDILYYSGKEYHEYNLLVTIKDVQTYVSTNIASEVWDDNSINKIKKFIENKIESSLDGVKINQAIILKGELKFMNEMGYRLKQNANEQCLSQDEYKIHNREALFSANYLESLKKEYDDETMVKRLHGFKFGHIIIETILDKLNNKIVIPKDDLTISANINAYVFNIVISGTTHDKGTKYLYKASKKMEEMKDVKVLSPKFDRKGKLKKDISPDTEYEHLTAIDDCDVLFICNKYNNGYIGESTKCEIYYAYALRKTIAFWQKPIEDVQLSFIPKEYWPIENID